MSKLTIDIANIYKAVDWATNEGALALIDEIVQITPRDPKRLPIDRNAKVTWNLKRSIQHERLWFGHYKVGVAGAWVKWSLPISIGKWATPARYWFYQEFGTKYIKPRSFIRKSFIEKQEKIKNIIVATFFKLFKS